MKKYISIVLGLSLFLTATTAQAAPKVFFENVKNGQTIEKGFVAKFGLKGMKIHPAGELVEGTGHHHLIITTGVPTKGVSTAIAEGQVIPADATHVHFGKGQAEYKLDLAPGDYVLTLQFANGSHISYGQKMSTSVHVHVK